MAEISVEVASFWTMVSSLHYIRLADDSIWAIKSVDDDLIWVIKSVDDD